MNQQTKQKMFYSNRKKKRLKRTTKYNEILISIISTASKILWAFLSQKVNRNKAYKIDRKLMVVSKMVKGPKSVRVGMIYS